MAKFTILDGRIFAPIKAPELNPKVDFDGETVPKSGYGINSIEEAFVNFEPYHCGEYAFPDKILMINGKTIGPFQQYPEYLDEKTRNIVVEEASKEIHLTKEDETKNKFTKVGYKIENRFVKGCKKGTVVLANRPNSEQRARLLNENTDTTSIEVKQNADQKILYINNNQFQEKTYFKDSGFPIKLGVLLAGGGGGAGGGTWYDPDKNGKSDTNYYCSGGSGGGGGTIWGCIDLTNLEKEDVSFNTKHDNFRNWIKEISKNNYKLIKADTNSIASLLALKLASSFDNSWNVLMQQISDIKTKDCYIIAYDNKYVDYKSKEWQNLLYNLNNNQTSLTVNFNTILPLYDINKSLYEKIFWKLIGLAGATGSIAGGITAALITGPAAILALITGFGISAATGKTDSYLKIANYFNLNESEFKDLCKALNKNYPTEPINGRSGITGGTYPITNNLTHNSPQIGTNGIKGADLILYKATKLSFTLGQTACICYITKPDTNFAAIAYGGGGGASGHWSNTAGGGEGNNAKYNKTYFNLCGSITGENGISVNKDTEEAVIAAKSFYIDFLPDTTEHRELSEEVILPRLAGTLSTTTSTRIPGGHGFGRGADRDNAAQNGGGGCSNENSNGAKPYWAIYF